MKSFVAIDEVVTARSLGFPFFGKFFSFFSGSHVAQKKQACLLCGDPTIA